MPKGVERGNREAKKPKKDKPKGHAPASYKSSTVNQQPESRGSGDHAGKKG
ncbi:MAG TPA: hypothetical protein VND97_06995 [Beijerinckiaceae bacterium]|nr:hypothetical protein [Beijerinckiaceae bacterium]